LRRRLAARAAAGPSVRSGLSAARRFATLVAAFALFAAAAPAEAARLSATADTTRIRVGDPIHLRVRLVTEPGSKLELPAIGKTLGSLEVLSWTLAAPRERNGEREIDGVAVVTAWATGAAVIPPIVASGDSTVRTEPIAIRVESVGIEESKDVRAIRGPVSLPRNWLLIAAIALGSLLVALAAFLLVRRLRRKRLDVPAAPIVARPAHELAYEALDRLAAERLVERGHAAEHVTRLADILRDYHGARFGFLALDMTTSEIVAALRPLIDGGSASSRMALAETRAFLEEADLVKFAEVVPDDEQARGGLTRVRHVVDETRVRDEQPLAEAS
jgi:hypothetical protein